MNEPFTFHTDPGHGWLEVPQRLLGELEINNKVSTYSYQRGMTVYLEEDCDAILFVGAFEKKYGRPPKTVTKYYDNSCFIRHLGGY